jgi:hypothetical protein
MAALTMRPVDLSEVEASSDGITAFRDRLASRSEEYDRTYPRALDLEAKVLLALHGALHGVATLVRGLHSPQRFRDKLMGLSHLPLADVCRLATEPSREPRAGALAVVQELATALGYRLEPMSGKAVDAHLALAQVVESHSALTAETIEVLADGVITPEEARGLRPEIEDAKAKLANLDSIITKAEQAS